MSARPLPGHNCKLNWTQVDSIRVSSKSSASLAGFFNVTHRNINYVRSYTTWKEPDKPRNSPTMELHRRSLAKADSNGYGVDHSLRGTRRSISTGAGTYISRIEEEVE
jgi:hypothetical protein